ncbi:hypothetical protein D9M69_560720 [compost metagenome]
MRDLEAFARKAVQEVAGDRFACGEADAVHEAVEGGPGLREVGEELVDLRIVAHVAVENQFRAEVCGIFGDTVLESLADITEGEFRALVVTGLGNAICNGAIAQHTGDQQFLAGKKAHEVAS